MKEMIARQLCVDAESLYWKLEYSWSENELSSGWIEILTPQTEEADKKCREFLEKHNLDEPKSLSHVRDKYNKKRSKNLQKYLKLKKCVI